MHDLATAVAADDHVITLIERAIASARNTQVDPARAALSEADRVAVSGATAARRVLADAYLAYFSRRPDQAADLSAQAQALATAAGAPALAARCLGFAAACALRIDGEHRWRTVLEQLACARELADKRSDAQRAQLDRREANYLVDTLTGTIEQYAGRLDLALAAYGRALGSCLEIGDVTGIGALRHRMAFTQSDLLRERWFEQRPHRADPWRPTVAELSEAMTLVRSSIDFAQVNGVPTNLPIDQIQCGFLLLQGGHAALALSQLERALPLVGQARPLAGEAIYARAVSCLCLLELDRADEAAAASTGLLADIDDSAAPNALAYVWRAQQWVCETRGDTAAAEAAFAQSQRHWQTYRALQRQIAQALA